MLKSFARYYKPHWKLFVLDMVCALIAASCDLMYPVISRNIINTYIPDKNLQLIFSWCAALLVIYIIQTIMQYIMQYQGHVVGVRMQADMRRDVFTHLQKLPFSYFDEHKTGVIMSRIVNDLMDISEFAHHGPEDLFISAVTIIGSFIILCTVNVPLTLLTFIMIPFLVLFIVKKRTAMTVAFRKNRIEIAEVNASLENSIAGVRVARAFTGEAEEQKKFNENNQRYVAVREKAYRVMAEFFSGTNFLTAMMNVIILAGGGYCVYAGVITVGDMVAYMLFINMFVTPIKKLIQFVEMFQNAITGYVRFEELMNVQPEKEDEHAQELTDVKGEITFDNVTFQYDKGKEVLSNISLTCPLGMMVALVGPSGGGKTTLCHLIPRFYEISSGSISVDGHDIRTVTRSSLRQKIGIVQQDVFLFTGTIFDNIAYGKLGASREEVIEAAKKANIHDYIMSLPEGYETFVGERGVKLSGGQKQRISIARVFLKNPPILVLDEATSALDNVTENYIQDSLDELCKNRTTIVVAHRLSTIKHADEIIVMDRDGIQERGTHAQLLEKENGIYKELYEAQFARI
ncbi:ABC transporter ATP-binding protein [Negativibacillus massiliensis]|uniref:ABC transporter ATP-binding protein n=1 Tax=Negativibacillus massiliensis TaxID=1871035 RepID=UPI002A7F5087|nr:ABC transporter ATP-binding protein [Negativibacillus massiliensis]MDY4046978.1 ABC transporter ATP-binding protein [Negativibacillus massiliensis]